MSPDRALIHSHLTLTFPRVPRVSKIAGHVRTRKNSADHCVRNWFSSLDSLSSTRTILWTGGPVEGLTSSAPLAVVLAEWFLSEQHKTCPPAGGIPTRALRPRVRQGASGLPLHSHSRLIKPETFTSRSAERSILPNSSTIYNLVPDGNRRFRSCRSFLLLLA